jgi:hypothetical protein
MRRVVIMAALAVAALRPGPTLAGGASLEPEGGVASGRLLRVIDDPSTGARWLLYEDTQHPGGPARLVEVALKEVKTGWSSSPTKESDKVSRFCIHAGDRLTVEEHTPIADSNLAAVALGQAGKGEALEVRLVIGGRVVKAVAEEPGRARLRGESGGQP